MYWWQSGSTERNPLCLVMIIPCISCIAPTMYTARFEPAEQICAPHGLNIYLYMHKPRPVTYIYIYISNCVNINVYIQKCLHTHICINIYIYIPKNCGKVAQPRNTQLRHFLLGHHCPVQ